MRNIVTVGAGDYYSRILKPALIKMQKEGLIHHLATVDTKFLSDKGVRHLIRNGESLSEVLAGFLEMDPMVILAHPNHMHVSDTINLSTSGFKVALEKPYALHGESLRTLLRESNIKNVYLLEYYLMMKISPLLLGYGEIKKISFYIDLIKPRENLYDYVNSVRDFYNKLPEIVGEIKSIHVDVLEGEGETGRVDHRGVTTTDIRSGGGMIQDMLIHGLVPIISLEKQIGEISKITSRVAICSEYAEMAKVKFGLEDKHIGESYVEVNMQTEWGIPATVRVGKYVYQNKNKREVSIQGSKGTVLLDMNSCTLYVNDKPVLGVEKDEYKYYTVIRSAIEYFDQNPLYEFDPNYISSKAQRKVLNIQDEVYRTQHPTYYHSGIDPEDIF